MQARLGGFYGKPGRFWVVRRYIDGVWLYWAGLSDGIARDDAYSEDPNSAAQFFCEDIATMAADLLGGSRDMRKVEEHIFSPAMAG